MKTYQGVIRYLIQGIDINHTTCIGISFENVESVTRNKYYESFLNENVIDVQVLEWTEYEITDYFGLIV